MRSKVRVLGHPAHAMMVMLPMALLPVLVVFDALHLVGGVEGAWVAGFWLAALGGITALAAMVPGMVDFAAIPGGTRAHRIGVFHLVVGLTVAAAYGATLAARWPAGSVDGRVGLAVAIDVVGLALVGLQGWLGGELVYQHHVGVRSAAEGADPAALAPGGRRVERRRRAPRRST